MKIIDVTFRKTSKVREAKAANFFHEQINQALPAFHHILILTQVPLFQKYVGMRVIYH